MTNEVKPDPDIPSTSPNFDDLQSDTKKKDFEQRLKRIRKEVPTRNPGQNFLRQFEIVDLGNNLSNLYGYIDNEWKMIGGGLVNFDNSTTTVQNTTTETDLTNFTLKKNALNANGKLEIEIPISELDLLSASSDNELTFKLYLDSTVINNNTITNDTGSDITDDDGLIKYKIFNDGGKSSQRITARTTTTEDRNFTSLTTSSIDTTIERTVKVTATFESANSSNKIVVGNSSARIVS